MQMYIDWVVMVIIIQMKYIYHKNKTNMFMKLWLVDLVRIFQFKNYNIDLWIVCEPEIGIVTFVIANLLSMAYSHIFIFLDQQYG